MRILGLDPGLVHTGWGVIESEGSRLRHVADGRISPPASHSLPERLAFLDSELAKLIEAWQPDMAAVEETFVNKNAASTLKLGQARGVVLLAPARVEIPVAEYAANLVKKSVVGTGHAAKEQIAMMVGILLNIRHAGPPDAADALAVAICHAHHCPQHIPSPACGGGSGRGG
jgi:crossover junction endodeoxyribonuclease RuvC